MRAIFLFSFLLILWVSNLSAQAGGFRAYNEIGLLAAMTNYSGDIAEKRLELGETKIGLGLFFRRTMAEHLALKGQVYYGQITGDDLNSSTIQLVNRKYRFTTNFVEVSGTGEFSLLSTDRGYYRAFTASPYFFGGFGLTYAKAVADCYGGIGRDCPFPEDDPQKLYLTIPMGVGVKLTFDDRLAASAEIGWRPVFSDKLDGVSVTGNPNKKDWYFILGLGLSYMME